MTTDRKLPDESTPSQQAAADARSPALARSQQAAVRRIRKYCAPCQMWAIDDRQETCDVCRGVLEVTR
jgi:hypothetical protein